MRMPVECRRRRVALVGHSACDCRPGEEKRSRRERAVVEEVESGPVIVSRRRSRSAGRAGGRWRRDWRRGRRQKKPIPQTLTKAGPPPPPPLSHAHTHRLTHTTHTHTKLFSPSTLSLFHSAPLHFSPHSNCPLAIVRLRAAWPLFLSSFLFSSLRYTRPLIFLSRPFLLSPLSAATSERASHARQIARLT